MVPRHVPTGVASSLTGLSTDQLREWSSRRALIPADIQNRGRGSPAQYSWETVLLLRVAALLKDRFHLELQAHMALFAAMREFLGKVSFLKLWGSSLAIYDAHRWALLTAAPDRDTPSDAIIVRLDPHLAVLAAAFAMPGPASVGQLELFPARLVTADQTIDNEEAAADVHQPALKRA